MAAASTEELSEPVLGVGDGSLFFFLLGLGLTGWLWEVAGYRGFGEALGSAISPSDPLLDGSSGGGTCNTLSSL